MATYRDSPSPFHESTSDRRYSPESVKIGRSGGTDKVWAGGGDRRRTISLSTQFNSSLSRPFDHASSPDFSSSLTSLGDLRIPLLASASLPGHVLSFLHRGMIYGWFEP